MSAIHVSTHGDIASVAIKGNFSGHDVESFNKVLRLTDNEALKSIYMDFHKAEAIDDAALGMLMLLRLRAMQTRKRVALCHARGDVKKLFTRTRLEQMFRTSPLPVYD
jgi:anti-anti-sigma factor